MSWLENGAELLSEPDPGDTPFLVERLIVDPSILAIVGPPKVGKTWALLELAVSIATGRPAFGALEVRQGPVILVLEESGRTALHRRLMAICRGRSIDPAELQHLHFAANQRVSLVEDEFTARMGASWQRRLKDATQELAPAAVIFDPLARVKGLADENSQQEMAEILDFMRELRDHACKPTVGFVHHTGHASASRMRGSSDMESVWESKVSIQRRGNRCTLTAEHREAEATGSLDYRVDFRGDAVRLELDVDTGPVALRREIVAYLAEHPDSSFQELRDGIRRNKTTCRSELSDLQASEKVTSRRIKRPDRNGVPRPVEVYNVTPHAGLTADRDSGTDTDRDGEAVMAVRVPHPIEGGTGRSDIGNGTA